MKFEDGDAIPDTKEQVLNTFLQAAKNQFGKDINDGRLSTIRLLYEPVAEKFVETQKEIGLVLESAQIDNATGDALDLLTALIGVQREQAEKATVTLTFQRDSAAPSDYVIQQGQTVQTVSNDPIEFEVTESTVLSAGTTSVDAPAKAVEAGPGGNVGANTLIRMPNPPAGLENDGVINNNAATGGEAEETDDELRQRAKQELAEGTRASAPALVSEAETVDGVTSSSIFTNTTDQDNTGSGGLPPHSFELVVAGGDNDAVAQSILETKAAGDTSYAGANGTADSGTATLPNGQSLSVEFSRPSQVQIYVEADLVVEDQFQGTAAVKNAIIEYTGGTRTTGQETSVGLDVGEDVIFGEVEYQIRSVDGVHDINNLYVDRTDGTTNQSNVTMAKEENPFCDGTDSSLTFTTSQV